MNISELKAKFAAAGRRVHVVGTEENGVLMALDVEGRLFAFMGGEVLNRVNEEAIAGITTREGYINPGGDGFWPAPEGSTSGFEYPTGEWRVPPSLTNARWIVREADANHAMANAEVDLINASGLGMPLLLSRDITIDLSGKSMSVKVTEGIEYIGTREIGCEEAVIAPWSLCQFDCGKDSILRLPDVPASEIWDLYPWDSTCHRKANGQGYDVEMVTDFRFQLGMSEKINWIEFIDKKRGFSVKRTADPIADGLKYIAIDDIDSTKPCSNRPERFSAYCDPSGFMEIEAAGGAAPTLKKGTKTSLTVTNTYTLL